MIEIIEGVRDNVVAVKATGNVTRDDYENVLIPALSRAINEHGKIRFLYQVGPDFSGFEMGAAFDDAVFGMSHMFDFEKIAVVSDVDWVLGASRLFGFMLPAEVRVFDLSALNEAMTWVQS